MTKNEHRRQIMGQIDLVRSYRGIMDMDLMSILAQELAKQLAMVPA